MSNIHVIHLELRQIQVECRVILIIAIIAHHHLMATVVVEIEAVIAQAQFNAKIVILALI